MRHGSVQAATLLLLLASLAGCAAPPPPPGVLQLTMTGGAGQNPDAAGRPNSVAVHLYQLNSPAKFMRADVFGLLEREKETLGDDLAASETVLLPPGATVPLSRPLKPGVQVLGVVVAFRDIDSATWRVSAPLKPSGPTALDLTTAGTKATLAPPKAP